MTAVWPFAGSFVSGFAPFASSSLTGSVLPTRAAVISTVSPVGRLLFGSAPAFNSRSVIAALPLLAARKSGVTPQSFAMSRCAPAWISIVATSTSSSIAA
jgi:hypothetical protein